jgi:clan AA aspartic protease
MMQGYVNIGYEAVISLVIKHNNRLKSINAVIDTGFTGFLSLPQSIIDELELPWSYSDFATLGDGSETLFDVHDATTGMGSSERLKLTQRIQIHYSA